MSICRCSGVRRGAELHLSRPHPGAQAALVAARRPGAAPAYCSRRVSACGLDKLACTRLPNSGAAEPQQETTDNPTADSSRELRADGRHSTPEQLSPRSRRHRPPRANTEPARTALPARIIPRHRRRRAVCALARSSGARVCCAFQGIRPNCLCGHESILSEGYSASCPNRAGRDRSTPLGASPLRALPPCRGPAQTEPSTEPQGPKRDLPRCTVLPLTARLRLLPPLAKACFAGCIGHEQLWQPSGLK